MDCVVSLYLGVHGEATAMDCVYNYTCGGGCPEVEVTKLNSAKIYRFLQLLSHSRGFSARI